MKLYEISDIFKELFNKYEELTDLSLIPDIDSDEKTIDIDKLIEERENAWFETLDGLEEAFEVKAENIAKYIKNLKAQSDALKAEEDKLFKRRKSKENKIRQLKEYMLFGMKKINLMKIDKPSALITVRNNAESVKLDDEKEFVRAAENNEILRKYLKYTPEINRTLLKKSLQSGEIIPGAKLVHTQSVIIK